MTAAYGLPDHLFVPIETAVKTAWMLSSPGRATYGRQDLHTVTALWVVRVENEVHTDLLTPAYARELVAVITPAIMHNAERLEGLTPFDPDYLNVAGLDIHAEEVIMTLWDIATSTSLVA